jgi:hypothetical protein
MGPALGYPYKGLYHQVYELENSGDRSQNTEFRKTINCFNAGERMNI